MGGELRDRGKGCILWEIVDFGLWGKRSGSRIGDNSTGRAREI
jgi:hypothetical protein